MPDPSLPAELLPVPPAQGDLEDLPTERLVPVRSDEEELDKKLDAQQASEENLSNF